MLSTIHRIPPSPAEIAERLATKMGLVRQTLMSKGEYLSDPAMCGRVHWVPFGHGHMLALKSEDSPALDDAVPPLSPTDCVASTPPNCMAGAANTQLPTPDTTPTPSPTPVTAAVLAMVVQVVPGQSWLYPDGKWTGTTTFVKQFADVKLLCTGTAPEHMRFHNDYATSLASLKSIMAEMRTAGYPISSVLSGPDQNIKVRHALFAEYENADDADPNDIAFTRDWPTSTPKAAEDLAALAATHAVCPLPAYDINGVLIEPRWYARRLEGATVILRFHLNHHLIRNSKQDKKEKPTDTFSARLVQLRVIIPPPAASPATPRKRKVLPSDNYFGTFTPRKNPKDEDDDSDKENRKGPTKRLKVGVPSGSQTEGGMRS